MAFPLGCNFLLASGGQSLWVSLPMTWLAKPSQVLCRSRSWISIKPYMGKYGWDPYWTWLHPRKLIYPLKKGLFQYGIHLNQPLIFRRNSFVFRGVIDFCLSWQIFKLSNRALKSRCFCFEFQRNLEVHVYSCTVHYITKPNNALLRGNHENHHQKFV